jgi:hypothetical protein
MTAGQRAMATAMLYPEKFPGKKTEASFATKQVSRTALSKARTVRSKQALAERVLAGTMSLNDAKWRTLDGRKFPQLRCIHSAAGEQPTISRICSTSLSAPHPAPLHPSTPKGVVVEQRNCGTCSTFAPPPVARWSNRGDVAADRGHRRPQSEAQRPNNRGALSNLARRDRQGRSVRRQPGHTQSGAAIVWRRSRRSAQPGSLPPARETNTAKPSRDAEFCLIARGSVR